MGCGTSKHDDVVPATTKAEMTEKTEKAEKAEKAEKPAEAFRPERPAGGEDVVQDLPKKAKPAKDEMVWSARRGSLIPKSEDEADEAMTKQLAEVLEGTKDTFNMK
eukprot:Opistho-1_new@20346